METRQPAVSCPQCGAQVPLADGAPFVTCGHCRASLYADPDSVVRHVVLAPRLAAGEARGALERFLAAAEIESEGRRLALRLRYLPWYVVPSPSGRALVAASGESALAARPREAPDAGGESPFDAAALGDADVVAPAISLEDAVLDVEGGRARGAHLLHAPIWRIDFDEGPSRFTAHVDAVDGDVFATKLPPSSSRRMDRVAIVQLVAATAVFAAEAALLPGFLAPVAAFAATGAVMYWFVRQGEGRHA